LAALASIPLVVPAGAWAALTLTATAASLLVMTLFFSPTLLIGFGIDAVMVWIVLMRIWQPA
jgi:hypothetical protein